MKSLLDGMMNRKQRSAIIVTSSIAAQLVFPCLTFYAATKVFVSRISRCLNLELKDKIDVMTWEPGYVKTKMTKMDHGKAPMATPERAV